MRVFPVAALVAAFSLVGTGPADAKGCIKGALVGGVAGHYVGKGHAVAGAAAGCLAGRHLAKKHARQQHAHH
jgi:uncharacterized protein YcfJ